MIQNYLKTALRNLLRNRLTSLINILGLAIGMTAFLLILHYVTYEKSYDRFHENTDRIYRLRVERTTDQDTAVRFASCAPPAGARIREQFSEVEKVGRILRYRGVMSHEDIKFLEERMFFVEPDFLEILQFPSIGGDPVTGLKNPNDALISRSTAAKYFGDSNPIGKTISLDKRIDYQVTGIFEDMPANSHIKMDFMLGYKSLDTIYGSEFQDAWGHTGVYTYLRLKQDAHIPSLQDHLADLVDTEFGEVLKRYRMIMTLNLQPLTDIHLTSHFMQEYEANGNIHTVNMLLIIAGFIIVMAWVNYINLSTAHSLTRAKEVGLRKVVGANRWQLINQFFIETFILNLWAIVIAILLVAIFLPQFCHLTSIPTSTLPWNQSWFWLTVASLFIVGSTLSGFYPVIALSSYHPVTVLKGKLGNKIRGINLRKSLVIFQFLIAMLLITGTFTVISQIQYMQQQDLGFSLEQTLVFRSPRIRDNAFREKFQTFKDELKKRGDISNICHVTEVPGRQLYWDAGAIRRAGSDMSESKNYLIVGADEDFAKVFDLHFIAGRNFSKTFSTDAEALILNERAIEWMGFESPEKAVGQQVDYWGNIYNIIGVVKNYHQESLKADYSPQIFRYMPTGRGVRGMFAVKIKSSDMPRTVEDIGKIYETMFPGNPYDYFFLDEYYDQQYQADRLLSQVVSIFSALAIFITALGIFGLSAYNAAQRTKEIGIRKVLGASISRILIMLIKDFVWLMTAAAAVAVPALIFGLNLILRSYANRMPLNLWLFILPIVMVALVTLLTISGQTVKSATANPIKALRYE